MNKHTAPRIPILELDLLKTLIAIAETGNFSLAASIVNRTPSAISMQVRKMEDILGRPIFVRNARSVELTDDGQILLQHGRRVLAMNNEVLANFMKPEVKGQIKLGASDFATEQFLPETLRRFSQTHPDVKIDVTVDGSQALRKSVASKSLDIAIVTLPHEMSEQEGFEILSRERLVWAGIKCGIAAEKVPLPISVWEEGCLWRKAALECLNAQNRPYNISFKCAHIAGQIAGIKADLAIAPLPKSACTENIIDIGEQHDLPKLPDFFTGIVWGAAPTPPVKAIIDHLRAVTDY